MPKLKEYTEPQLKRALRRLELRWPGGFWLFSCYGTLILMRGERGLAYEEDIAVRGIKIPNDGGDFSLEGGEDA